MKKPTREESLPGFAEEGQHAYQAVTTGTFTSRLTDAQKTELAEAIAEVERGDVIASDDVFRWLAEKYKIDL